MATWIGNTASACCTAAFAALSPGASGRFGFGGMPRKAAYTTLPAFADAVSSHQADTE